MPPKGQTSFEQSLIDALQSKSISDAITKIIINAVTSHLAEKFKEYDEKIAKLEDEIKNLKSTENGVQTNVSLENHKKLEQKVDNVQQHTKRNNIRLMGLKVTKNENIVEKVTEIIKNKMKVDMNSHDVVAAYRVGRNTNDRPRHVVITFQDNKLRSIIFNKKKMLKGTGYVMKEDLTTYRLKIVNETSEKYGFKNVWTSNGNIFAKTETGVEKILF